MHDTQVEHCIYMSACIKKKKRRQVTTIINGNMPPALQHAKGNLIQKQPRHKKVWGPSKSHCEKDVKSNVAAKK